MKKYLFSILLVLVFATYAIAEVKVKLSKDSPLYKLQIAEQIINNLYVDSVDENTLVENAICGMLEKLDPHSTYATPKQVAELTEPLNGEFDGIGVQYNMIEDTLVVVQTITDSPSEKVGIIAGDKIISVNDSSIAGVKMTQDEIKKRFRGMRGTRVKVGIIRSSIDDVLSFTITRDKIPVYSIVAYYMIAPHIGYIKMENFGAKTHQEFINAITLLRKEGMCDLILDLQNNGGGYLQAAINIANEFLSDKELIVLTKGRSIPSKTYYANGKGILQEGRVMVLVNEYTASASEIVSGALQDHDRGTIIGRRTFGKGLVQHPIPLNDGSMIKLTIAHYYTPCGRCIQKPYTKGDKKSYDLDLEHRLKHGELTDKDSISFPDSLKYLTLHQHRTIYGGGGIMPDYFVPLDTTHITRFYRELSAKSIILQQSLHYVDSHRQKLKEEYSNCVDFEKSFFVPQTLIDDIISSAKALKIKPCNEEELQSSLSLIRLHIKALIARDLWGMTSFYRIVNLDDNMIKKAIEILTKE